MIIRRLEFGDHLDLRALRLRALATEPEAFGSTFARELAFDESIWRERLGPNGHPHFGAFRDGTDLVGLAVGMVDADESGLASLVGMWIDPPDRGVGLSEQLIGEVLQWSFEQGVAAVRLYVTEGNMRAETVYQRLGFSRTGHEEIRERDGATEIEMRIRSPNDESPATR
jgi:ribosomal protein S18 acetylase RimI-like enzyme